MKKYGRLNPVQCDRMPIAYDKKNRIVNFGFVEKQVEDSETETAKTVYEGYSVQIDGILDYGHIKSQLVEAAYGQKDEFAFVINAADSLLQAIRESDTWRAFKDSLSTDDVVAFDEFNEYRALCSVAAHAVMDSYQ